MWLTEAGWLAIDNNAYEREMKRLVRAPRVRSRCQAAAPVGPDDWCIGWAAIWNGIRPPSGTMAGLPVRATRARRGQRLTARHPGSQGTSPVLGAAVIQRSQKPSLFSSTFSTHSGRRPGAGSTSMPTFGVNRPDFGTLKTPDPSAVCLAIQSPRTSFPSTLIVSIFPPIERYIRHGGVDMQGLVTQLTVHGSRIDSLPTRECSDARHRAL